MTETNGSANPGRIDPPEGLALGEVRARLDTLIIAHEQAVLRERFGAFREMTGALAHDFSEILSGILARAQILLDEAPDPLVARSVRMIEQVALEGTRMVRRLQDYSRTRPTHPYQPVDFNQLVREIVAWVRERWSEQFAAEDLSHDVSAETTVLPFVVGDLAELRHVLTSVALNALDAMPEGGHLTFRTGIEGPRVFCSIVDTGVGMSSDVRLRIFDPLFTTKREKSPGFGLGGVHAIVARHGGEIAVESEVGKGTAFTIWLPVAQTAEIAPETVAGPPPETPPPAPALGTRVLVVDDSDEVLEVLREVLDRHGCTAVTYPDGESALREIERDRIDVAMLDLTLPGISGLEVATRVTQRWPGATVAIMTGHFDGIDPDDARAKGIHFVLSKPFRLAEIRSVLDHAHTGVPG